MGNHPGHPVEAIQALKPKKVHRSASEAHLDISNEYEVLPIILGQGSFSIVKLCRKKSTGEEFAIKIVERDHHNPRLEAALENEIEIWRSCHHPNIVTLHQVYETRQNYMLVMDRMLGGELFDKINQIDHYSESLASQILTSILQGVAYLHTNLIVHRDLKPENLLLSTPNLNDTRIQIADFGIAARLPSPDAHLSEVVGTPGYIAPEILECRHRGAAGYSTPVDLWSVGVILYILLCGYPPFELNDDEDTCKRILAADIVFQPVHWDAISHDAKDLTLKLLSRNPATRLTAQTALQHPWLTSALTGATPATTGTMERLRSLNTKGTRRMHFKSAVRAIQALQAIEKCSFSTASLPSCSADEPHREPFESPSLPFRAFPTAPHTIPLTYFRVSTFTSVSFQGNPALIFPLSRWIPENLMRSIAFETQQRSCMFFMMHSRSVNEITKQTVNIRARWFTPDSELTVCGHASLGAAYTFWNAIAPEHSEVKTIQLKSYEGDPRLKVTRTHDPDLLCIILPAIQTFPLTEGLASLRIPELLGLPADIEFKVYCASVPKLFVVLQKQQHVERLVPHPDMIQALKSYSGVVVTAPGDAADYVLRYLCPKNGFDEDYATASVHAILTPFWSRILKKSKLTTVQLSVRRCLVSTEYVALDDSVRVEGRTCFSGQGSVYVPL